MLGSLFTSSVYVHIMHIFINVTLEHRCRTLKYSSAFFKFSGRILHPVTSCESHPVQRTVFLCVVYRAKRSIVFILNDMSRFVGAGRTTTLYLLLDLLHKHTGISVVGVSTFYGVLDLMEKRAKSRFEDKVLMVPSLSPTRDDEVRSQLWALCCSDWK